MKKVGFALANVTGLMLHFSFPRWQKKYEQSPGIQQRLRALISNGHIGPNLNHVIRP
jgi:hypothetical protein